MWLHVTGTFDVWCLAQGPAHGILPVMETRMYHHLTPNLVKLKRVAADTDSTITGLRHLDQRGFMMDQYDWLQQCRELRYLGGSGELDDDSITPANLPHLQSLFWEVNSDEQCTSLCAIMRAYDNRLSVNATVLDGVGALMFSEGLRFRRLTLADGWDANVWLGHAIDNLCLRRCSGDIPETDNFGGVRHVHIHIDDAVTPCFVDTLGLNRGSVQEFKIFFSSRDDLAKLTLYGTWSHGYRSVRAALGCLCL